MKKPYFLLIFCSLLIICIAISIGDINLFSKDISALLAKKILLQIRLPHVLLAFFTGASLSLSGTIYQSLFKNNLSSPYTLGIASGASLGAFCAEIFHFPYPFITSLIGSLICLILVIIIPYIQKVSLNLDKFLLTGVSLSFLFNAIILFIQFKLNSFDLKNAMHFLMGDLSIVGYHYLFFLIPASLITLFVLLYFNKQITLIEISDEYATVQGVNVRLVHLTTLIVASILISIVISYSGPIGFVGIVIPNIVRQYLNAKYKKIFIFSFLLGGIFLTSIDLISRSILASEIFPIGILTAIIGAPVFLYLLFRDHS